MSKLKDYQKEKPASPKVIPGLAWRCSCGKWNFSEARFCWKCTKTSPTR